MKYGEDNPYDYSSIVEVNDENYLVQGRLDDPLTLFRPINELLECERDNIQKMLGEEKEQ